MKKHTGCRLFLLAAVSLPLIALQTANAATPVGVTSDIALQNDGVLRGQFVNKAGVAKANETVVIAQKGKAIAVGKTDKQGRIAAHGMRPGLYKIETAKTSGVYRLWAPGTAPPKAKSAFLVVEDESVVRGQDPTFLEEYGPAIRGAAAGGAAGAGLTWLLDENPDGT